MNRVVRTAEWTNSTFRKADRVPFILLPFFVLSNGLLLY